VSFVSENKGIAYSEIARELVVAPCCLLGCAGTQFAVQEREAVAAGNQRIEPTRRGTSPHSERPVNSSVPNGQPSVVGIIRACGGALVFSFPMLMTMEMWWLGFTMSPFRLAVLILLNVPLLLGLSYYEGFEETYHRSVEIVGVFTAYAVAFLLSGSMLLLFGVLRSEMSAAEIIGKIVIQALFGSIGAMLALSQFGGEHPEAKERRSLRYEAGLFLMAVGALYLSASVAATEEMVLIAYKMTAWRFVALIALSLIVMHAFLSAAVAQGKFALPPHTGQGTLFFRFTIVGYAMALGLSLLILWAFGRTEGLGAEQILRSTLILGFPAALGAGAARKIL
jgi:putative integral membrane protein (TIGR02587 family)